MKAFGYILYFVIIFLLWYMGWEATQILDINPFWKYLAYLFFFAYTPFAVGNFFTWLNLLLKDGKNKNYKA
jgi:hypothetical protein